MPVTDTQYSAIAASGADAFDFLQGQLSHDLRLLDSRERLLAAWCNPKGRVITLLRVLRRGGSFRLLLPAELADEVVRRLTLFRFRAKVEFAVEDASSAELGATDGLGAWRLDNLRAGIAEIAAAQSEAFTPHMLNLDLIDALSLTKGCYTGQEIVARTHYRGASKRRLHGFTGAPAAPGDAICEQDRKIGTVVNAIGNELLAVVSSAGVGTELTVNGEALGWRRLPYELETGGFADAKDT